MLIQLDPGTEKWLPIAKLKARQLQAQAIDLKLEDMRKLWSPEPGTMIFVRGRANGRHLIRITGGVRLLFRVLYASFEVPPAVFAFVVGGSDTGAGAYPRTIISDLEWRYTDPDGAYTGELTAHTETIVYGASPDFSVSVTTSRRNSGPAFTHVAESFSHPHSSAGNLLGAAYGVPANCLYTLTVSGNASGVDVPATVSVAVLSTELDTLRLAARAALLAESDALLANIASGDAPADFVAALESEHIARIGLNGALQGGEIFDLVPVRYRENGAELGVWLNHTDVDTNTALSTPPDTVIFDRALRVRYVASPPALEFVRHVPLRNPVVDSTVDRANSVSTEGGTFEVAYDDVDFHNVWGEDPHNASGGTFIAVGRAPKTPDATNAYEADMLAWDAVFEAPPLLSTADRITLTAGAVT